jgi:integrase
MKRRSRGEGTIYFSNSKGLWIAKMTLPNSKRRVKYSKSQKAVRDWLQIQQNASRQGLLSSDDTVTLSEFLSNYMETVGKHKLRPKTIESYSSLIRLHIVPTLGRIRITNLRPDQIQSLYSQKLESGLSKRTVHYIHSIIHKSLNQALRWGLVHRNISDLVDAPSSKRRLPTVYNTEQVLTFLNSTKNDRFYPVYVLAVYGGLREGELLGIHREDCDLVNGTINVNHAIQYQIGNGVVITDLKTETSRRAVKLSQFALNVLKNYLEQLNKKHGLIFTTSSGKPINPRFLIKSFKSAIQKAGLPNIRFQDLRHTSASLLLLANVHPKVVQERLGHSTIVLTMDTYSHLIPSMQDEAAEKLDKILSPP